MPLDCEVLEEVSMYRFPMLTEPYVHALLATDEGKLEPNKNDAASVGFPETLAEDLVKAYAIEEEKDLETARTRPLRLDSLHL